MFAQNTTVLVSCFAQFQNDCVTEFNLVMGTRDFTRDLGLRWVSDGYPLVYSAPVRCGNCGRLADKQSVHKVPIRRPNLLYQHGLYFEPYLNSLLRATELIWLLISSHVLEIERGKYTVPKNSSMTDWITYAFQRRKRENYLKLVNCVTP